MLLLSKWWFWLLYFPWALYGVEMVSPGLGLAYFGVPVVVFVLFTIIQEILFGKKGAQYLLSSIKNITLILCACFYAYASQKGSNYQFFHSCVAVMTFLGYLLEMKQIGKAYKQSK